MRVTLDANGSTLSDPTGKTYNWDFENRLSSVFVPGTGTVTFKYDPFGRRVQKSSPLGTTNYLYDGADIIEETDNTETVLARYAQGLGVDDPLAQLRSGTTSYYQQDALGSATSLSNSAGALASTYGYDSFGNLTASTGTITNPVRYTSREFDADTGLSYYRARYYDPAIGRFISEDQIGFLGSGINFYAYVYNSPLNFVDPFGLTSMVYVVSTGQLIVDPEQPGKEPYAINASSGNGACMNKPKCSNEGNHGPIPPGIYNLRVSEISQPSKMGDIARYLRSLEDWGSFRVPLTPGPFANTFGRSGFFLHGGRWPGSAGCIDAGGGLFGDDTTNRLLQDLRADPDGNVPLVVLPEPPNFRFDLGTQWPK
jgi:RHS repeat-associated protein